MAIDLSKLSPAPWTAWEANPPPSIASESYGRVIGPRFIAVDRSECMAPVDAYFIAIARNLFDVMARRGWSFEQLENGRWVLINAGRKGWLFLNGQNWFAESPFEAAEKMIEADLWYRANVEKEPA